MINTDYKVIIVGASIAGSTLATQLGRGGIKTLLVDKANFPRRKPCGEGLSNVGLRMLDEIGLSEVVSRCPHRSFSGFTFWSRGTVNSLPFGEETAGIGIDRSYLDAALLSEATRLPAVEYVGCTQVREAEASPNRCKIILNGKPVTGQILVLADGVQSFLARKLGLRGRECGKRFGSTMLLEGTADPAKRHVNIFIEKDFELYCTPLGNGRLNISVLGGKSTMSALREARFRQSLVEKVSEHIGYEGELSGEPMTAGPLGSRALSAGGGRVMLIGDACESLDPIGGMGMTHALLSSSLAFKSIARTIDCSVRVASDEIRIYGTSRAKEVLALRGFTSLCYYSLKNLSSTKIFSASSQRVGGMVVGALHLSRQSLGTRLTRMLLTAAGAF